MWRAARCPPRCHHPRRLQLVGHWLVRLVEPSGVSQRRSRPSVGRCLAQLQVDQLQVLRVGLRRCLGRMLCRTLGLLVWGLVMLLVGLLRLVAEEEEEEEQQQEQQ